MWCKHLYSTKGYKFFDQCCITGHSCKTLNLFVFFFTFLKCCCMPKLYNGTVARRVQKVSNQFKRNNRKMPCYLWRELGLCWPWKDIWAKQLLRGKGEVSFNEVNKQVNTYQGSQDWSLIWPTSRCLVNILSVMFIGMILFFITNPYTCCY